MSANGPPSQTWLWKRKLTVIAFTFQFGLYGLDYGLTIANMWIYLKELVKTDHPKTFYSILMTGPLLSSVMLSIPITRYADRSHNIRFIVFACNTAHIIGNCMYIINVSPWILVVSRLISGCGNTFYPVAMGELAKCFKPEEFISKVALVGFGGGIGLMFAPAINAPFATVNIEIGSLHITFANISGIYMAVLFAIAQVVTYFTIHDLSKEYDTKALTEEKMQLIETTQNTDDGDGETSTSFPKEKDVVIKQVVKQLLTNRNSCLLISLAFFEMYMISNFHMWKSMLILYTLNWSVNAFYGFMLAFGLVSILSSIYFILHKFSNIQLFNFSIFGIIAYAGIQVIFLVLTLYNENKILNIFLIAAMALLYSSMIMVKTVLLIGFLSKMVSSKHQSLAQGIRQVAEVLGRISGYAAAPFQFEWMPLVGPLYICVLIIFLILLMIRRKSFIDPSVII